MANLVFQANGQEKTLSCVDEDYANALGGPFIRVDGTGYIPLSTYKYVSGIKCRINNQFYYPVTAFTVTCTGTQTNTYTHYEGDYGIITTSSASDFTSASTETAIFNLSYRSYSANGNVRLDNGTRAYHSMSFATGIDPGSGYTYTKALSCSWYTEIPFEGTESRNTIYKSDGWVPAYGFNEILQVENSRSFVNNSYHIMVRSDFGGFSLRPAGSASQGRLLMLSTSMSTSTRNGGFYAINSNASITNTQSAIQSLEYVRFMNATSAYAMVEKMVAYNMASSRYVRGTNYGTRVTASATYMKHDQIEHLAAADTSISTNKYDDENYIILSYKLTRTEGYVGITSSTSIPNFILYKSIRSTLSASAFNRLTRYNVKITISKSNKSDITHLVSSSSTTVNSIYSTFSASILLTNNVYLVTNINDTRNTYNSGSTYGITESSILNGFSTSSNAAGSSSYYTYTGFKYINQNISISTTSSKVTSPMRSSFLHYSYLTTASNWTKSSNSLSFINTANTYTSTYTYTITSTSLRKILL